MKKIIAALSLSVLYISAANADSNLSFFYSGSPELDSSTYEIRMESSDKVIHDNLPGGELTSTFEYEDDGIQYKIDGEQTVVDDTTVQASYSISYTYPEKSKKKSGTINKSVTLKVGESAKIEYPEGKVLTISSKQK